MVDDGTGDKYADFPADSEINFLSVSLNPSHAE